MSMNSKTIPVPGPAAEYTTADLLAAALEWERRGSRALARAADLRALAARLEAGEDVPERDFHQAYHGSRAVRL